jgi:UDP-2,3-diacylglucosamine pyrophosphatase LpxH
MGRNINILVLLACFISVAKCWAQEGKSLTITHGPYLQNVSETGATIIFNTNKLVVPGIMIKQEGGDFNLIHNSHDGLINVGENIHKVRLDNLSPGQKYEYRLFACEIMDYRPYKSTYGDTLISKSYTFQTFDSDADQLNFTVFCDIHDRADKLGNYLNSNDIEKQDCYFLNGDIMGHIEEEEQLYSSFLDTCVNRFASEKPFFYARGNHETRGKFARQLIDYLDFSADKFYYAQTLGPVRFVVLDGGEDKPDDSKEYSGLVDFDRYRLEELDWLKNEVASDDFKEAFFRIVIVHMPIIKNNKNWYGMEFLAEHFGPVLNEANIDLMISGHTIEMHGLNQKSQVLAIRC